MSIENQIYTFPPPCQLVFIFGAYNPMSDFPLHRRSRLKHYEISEERTPNYLFAIWIKEWYEEAASRDSKLQFAYRKVCFLLWVFFF